MLQGTGVDHLIDSFLPGHLSSQKVPLVQGNSLVSFAAVSIHKRVRERPESVQGCKTFLHHRSQGGREGAGLVLWQPQATGTFRYLGQLLHSPAWWHLAGIGE